jgi:biotin synthase-related radical SAM superfamily protein
MSWLKVRLLAEGLRIELPDEHLARIAKPMMRVRSGSCGGLDLILPDGTWVNAPVREPFAKSSSLRLRAQGKQITLVDGNDGHAVTLVPAPDYYGLTTRSQRSMQRVGQLCSDRLGIGVTNVCTFYRSRERRCRFCSIGSNVTNEEANKNDEDIVETVIAAVEDPVAPARHLLLGGGTPDGDDSGAHRIAALAHAIKARCDVSIYAMLAPPRDLDHLVLLAEAGIDEIGMNIEVFSEVAARRFIPGKHAAIPLAHYWKALEHAVSLFGPVNTRSITVVGLEPAADTIAGVERLAAAGVLPILSPLRPLDGTALQDHPRMSAAQLEELTLAAAEAAGRHGMPLGPVCIACQSNTLTVPGHPLYRMY